MDAFQNGLIDIFGPAGVDTDSLGLGPAGFALDGNGIVESTSQVEFTESQASEGAALPLVSAEVDEACLLAGIIPEPTIMNVIASVHLHDVLDLRQIAISARNTEYNPRKVNAVVMRLRDPRCTGLIFRNGRMLVTGSKDDQAAKHGGKKMAKVVMKAGHPDVKFCGFKVENVIATADCRFPIRLEGLANDHREFCSYEPELFPGLVYRYQPQEDNRAVLLLFVSGKVIITGCKTKTEVRKVFEAIYPVLCQYQK